MALLSHWFAIRFATVKLISPQKQIPPARYPGDSRRCDGKPGYLYNLVLSTRGLTAGGSSFSAKTAHPEREPKIARRAARLDFSRCQLPDEIQRLVFVPEPPASPALVQQMPVVLGAVRFDWVPALVAALMRPGEQEVHVREEEV